MDIQDLEDALNIELEYGYRIVSEKRNFILQRRPTKEAKKEWVDHGYYSRMEHLLNAYLREVSRKLPAKTLEQYIKNLETITELLNTKLRSKTDLTL